MKWYWNTFLRKKHYLFIFFFFKLFFIKQKTKINWIFTTFLNNLIKLVVFFLNSLIYDLFDLFIVSGKHLFYIWTLDCSYKSLLFIYIYIYIYTRFGSRRNLVLLVLGTVDRVLAAVTLSTPNWKFTSFPVSSTETTYLLPLCSKFHFLVIFLIIRNVLRNWRWVVSTQQLRYISTLLSLFANLSRQAFSYSR